MWRSLGTITPTLDWQTFSLPTTSETFRITYGGNLARVGSFAYIRHYLAADIVTKSSRLYPKNEQEVIELPIPRGFRETGQVIYYLGVMKFPKRIRFVLPDTNWSLTVEEWL